MLALNELMQSEFEKTPGLERFLQSPQFVATWGGGEANVAVALAQFGLPATYVTVLPENPIADACIGELRRFSKLKRAPTTMRTSCGIAPSIGWLPMTQREQSRC